MADAEDFLPTGYTPTVELMVEKAKCSECGLKSFEDVRAWANAHVRATGHPVALTLIEDGRSRMGEKVWAVSPVAQSSVEAVITQPAFYDPGGERLHG